MENENNELTEQEKQEIAKLYEKTVDDLTKQYEQLKNPTSLAEAIEGITEEAAEILAEHFKKNREINEANPEGEEKPL